MATPLEAAAEALAPPAPTTRFFTGAPSVVSQLYTSRRGAESSAALADEATRLGRSRWDRAAQRRQLTEWGREDQEHAARKSFEAQRGEFLSQIGLIDQYAPDYEERKAELLATLPRQAMDDDAVRAIFAAKDRGFEDRMRMDESDRRYELRRQEDEAKTLDAARKAFVLEGGDPEAAAKVADPYRLYNLAGEYKRMNAKERADYNNDLILGRERERAGIRGTGNVQKGRERRAALETAVMDEGRFPEELVGETPEERLTELLNMAANEKEDKWVEAAGADLSDYGKQTRRAVWQEAQKMKAALGTGETAPPLPPGARPPLTTETAPPLPPGVDMLAPPRPGTPIDAETARKFLAVSGGDPIEATQRAEAAGWAVPEE